MEKEAKVSLRNIVEEFIVTTKKHNEILERQTESLINNTINKDCKSKIYAKIKEVEDEVTSLKVNLTLCDKKANKVEEYLKGDGVYSKGLIQELKELTLSINEIKDYIKEKATTKKNFVFLYNILSGAGGAVIIAVMQHFFK